MTKDEQIDCLKSWIQSLSFHIIKFEEEEEDTFSIYLQTPQTGQSIVAPPLIVKGIQWDQFKISGEISLQDFLIKQEEYIREWASNHNISY